MAHECNPIPPPLLTLTPILHLPDLPTHSHSRTDHITPSTPPGSAP